MITSITVAADMENNAEQWWDAFREAFPPLIDSDPELHAICAKLTDEAEVEICDPATIQRFCSLVESLPGWEEGPTHARTALVITPN